MRIVVVSDSHRNHQSLEMVLRLEPNADLYLHAGDIEEDPKGVFPFICVKGNCDYFPMDSKRVIPLGKHQLYITHGHLFYLTRENILKISKDNNCDIFIHGHIHKYYYEYAEGVHIICPGSISRPRDNKKSYVVLEIENENVLVTQKVVE